MNNHGSDFSGAFILTQETGAPVSPLALTDQILFDTRFKTWSIPEHVKNEYLQFCAYIKTFYFQMVVQR